MRKKAGTKKSADDSGIRGDKGASTAADSIIQRTRIDFDVELLATSGESILFGALRKGGNQRISAVMGAWHFVAVGPMKDMARVFQTRQWHIPRFQMASALRQQDHYFKSVSYEDPIRATWFSLPTLIRGRNKLSFVLDEFGEFQLPELFVKEMKKDLPILESAKERVRERSGEFYLSRMKTPAGNSIEFGSEQMLEAIAFEKLTVPRLTAANFGIYSAYCTYRDFDDSAQMSDQLVRALAEAQLANDSESLCEESCDIFAEVQKQLLSKPIWGTGIRTNVDQAAPILATGMAKLTRTQRTQFMLMEGMHGSGLLLPLAAILGICSFEQYADYVCQGMAPDSPEEQDRRIETAYIKLFGELGND